MKNTWKTAGFAAIALFISTAFVAQTTKYKVMLQMQNYTGKNAYVQKVDTTKHFLCLATIMSGTTP